MSSQGANLKLRLTIAVVALTLCVLGLLAYGLYSARLRQEEAVATEVENLGELLEQGIHGSVQRIDLSLLNIVDQLQRDLQQHGRLNATVVNAMLQTQRAWQGDVVQFRVADATGAVRYGPGVLPGSTFSYADRAFFADQRADPSRGLLVSGAVLGRVSGIWVVVFSRRYNDPAGHFAGVVAAAVPLRYFSELLSKLQLGAHGAAAVRGATGGLLARVPPSAEPAAQVGSRLYSSELAAIMASGKSAVLYRTGTLPDGSQRISSYRRLSGTGLQVLVGRSDADYLAEWRSRVHKAIGASLAFVALTLLLAWGLWRSFEDSERARKKSESLLGERNAALRNVETQTRLLSEVMESLPYGLVVFDDQWVMRLHNSNFLQILQLPAALVSQARFGFAEMVEYGFARGDFKGAASAQEALAPLKQAVAARRILTAEQQLADGGYVEFRSVPISAGWTVITYLDITERRQKQQVLSDAQTRVRLATESAGLGIWEYDLASGRLTWDAQQYRLHGLVPGQVPSDYALWASRVHPEDLARMEQSLANTVAHGVDLASDFRIIWDDGSVHHIRALARPRFDSAGKVVYLVGTNRDVTESLLSAQSLKDARDKAQEASISKGLFLANMSHEIRTPMNAVLGLLQLLGATPLRRDQLDYVEKIDSAARSLLGLLNDILDFSKIEADKLDLEVRPFQSEKLLRDLAVVLSAYVGHKPVEVLYDIDPQLPAVLVGDILRLKQVLVNLGANAVKFTPSGQVVVSLQLLAIERGDRSTARVEFQVRDCGIGIAPDNVPLLFNSFSQAEASTTRRFGGTGLGLAICKRLVDLMGGSISLTSELGVGTTFKFTLCLPFDPAGAAPPRPGPAPAALQVLLVDDNAQARTTLAKAMHSLGWEVAMVESGEQALAWWRQRLAQQGTGALVLVDCQLQGMDGWQTVQALTQLVEAHPGAALPRFLMLSSHGRENLAQRTPQEQAQIGALLVKPVTAAMLSEAASAIFQDAGGERRVERSSKRELAGLHILVVEDNAINQQVAEELLAAQGAMVSIAADGRQGVNAIASARPQYDAVLMDVQMPVLDGYAATRVIRESMGLRSLPIIGLTANAMESDRQKCLQAGMDDHLGKPFDLAQLVSILLRLTRRQPGAGTALPNEAALPAVTQPTLLRNEDIDLPAALQRMGGMQALYVRAARVLLAELEEFPARLLSALDLADGTVATTLLHTCKGTSATLGLTALARQLARLESACKSGRTKVTLDAELDALHICLDGARQALRQAIGLLDLAPPGTATEPLVVEPPEQLQAQLAPLMEALQAGDLAALELFAQLRGALQGLQPALFGALELAIQNLDLPLALELCRQIIDQHAVA